MIELVTGDDPDVVCLQEVPAWALGRLESWSGMQSVGAVAAAPLLRSAELGRWITELNHGLLRSAVTGEALAILVAGRGHVVAWPAERRRVEGRLLSDHAPVEVTVG